MTTLHNNHEIGTEAAGSLINDLGKRSCSAKNNVLLREISPPSSNWAWNPAELEALYEKYGNGRKKAV